MRAKQILCFNISRIQGEDFAPKNSCKPPVTSAAFHSNDVVLMLFESSFIVAAIVCGWFVFGPCFVVQ